MLHILHEASTGSLGMLDQLLIIISASGTTRDIFSEIKAKPIGNVTLYK